MGGKLRLILCIFSLLLCANSAAAAEGRVLLVQPPRSDQVLFEAFNRLKAELKIQGFETIVFEVMASQIAVDSLEKAATDRDAFAAVAISRSPGSTTALVRIVDRITGKSLTRQLDITDEKGGPTMLAIRATELLRTSLLEVDQRPETPSEIIGVQGGPPPDEVLRFTHEPRLFQAAAGLSSFWHPDLGFAWGANLVFSVRPKPMIKLSVEVAGPVFGGDYRADSGAATVRQELGLLGASWSFGARQTGRHWEGGPHIALGVAHLAAQGESEEPFVSHSETMWAFAMTGGGFVEFSINETLRVGLNLNVLTLLPRPVVAVANQGTAPLAFQGTGALRVGFSF